jgi:hypothetical protein
VAKAEREKKPRLHSPIGIACFVHVFRPEAPNEKAKNKEPKFKMMLVFDKETWKNDPAAKALRAACVAAAEAKFGADAREKIKKGKLKMPWRDASDYGDEGYGFPFDVEGNVMISFSSKEQPGVVDRKAKPLMKESEFYAGCTARVSYGVWGYDTDGNRGVTLFLNNVQKVADGERLAGRPEAEDDFDSVPGEDGAEDDDEMDI